MAVLYELLTMNYMFQASMRIMTPRNDQPIPNWISFDYTNPVKQKRWYISMIIRISFPASIITYCLFA